MIIGGASAKKRYQGLSVGDAQDDAPTPVTCLAQGVREAHLVQREGLCDCGFDISFLYQRGNGLQEAAGRKGLRDRVLHGANAKLLR